MAEKVSGGWKEGEKRSLEDHLDEEKRIRQETDDGNR